MPSTDRKPLQPLPLLSFLVASSSSSSSSPQKHKRTIPALKDRDMSLLPSPLAASTSTTPRTAQGPLATLYDAPSPRRSDASSSLVASPSRAMMDDDDAQNRAEDELPVSSPRRLLDAFLHSASPGKARRGGSMLPPQSPRRGAVVQKAEEEFMPTWSIYEDAPDASLAPEPSHSPSTPSTLTESASPTAEDAPLDKENSRPRPRPRLRSTSTAPSASSLSASPAPTTAPGPAPHSPPHTPPAASSAAAAFISPSLALSLSASGGGGAGASSFFAETGPTSFASASVGGGEGGFGGLLPAFEAGVRGKKRDSLEEAGAAGVKRARREDGQS